MKILVFILVVLAVVNSYSQNSKVDSLTLLLNSTDNDFEKSKLNLQLARMFESINLEKGKIYAIRALELSKNDSLSAEATSQLGRFYYFT